MIDDQDDQVHDFYTQGDVPYFPFAGLDRIECQDSTLAPRRLEFNQFDEPKLVSEDIASSPNAIESEERRDIEPKQEREDGTSRSREDEKPDERTT
jgi:hypothetical protein